MRSSSAASRRLATGPLGGGTGLPRGLPGGRASATYRGLSAGASAGRGLARRGLGTTRAPARGRRRPPCGLATGGLCPARGLAGGRGRLASGPSARSRGLARRLPSACGAAPGGLANPSAARRLTCGGPPGCSLARGLRAARGLACRARSFPGRCPLATSGRSGHLGAGGRRGRGDAPRGADRSRGGTVWRDGLSSRLSHIRNNLARAFDQTPVSHDASSYVAS